MKESGNPSPLGKMRRRVRYRAYRFFLRVFAPELTSDAYRGVLGRGPDVQGLAIYVPKLTKGDLSGVIDDLRRSDEFQKMTLAALAPGLARDIFIGLLEREPGAEWCMQTAAKVAETGKLTDSLAQTAHSEEFRRRFLAAIAPNLVRDIYQGLFGRDPEPRARSWYAAQVAEQGNVSDTLSEIVRSSEFRARSLMSLASDLVTSVYQAMLGREPEAEARTSYAANVAERGNLNYVLTEVLGSDEFHRRFVAAIAPHLVRDIFQGLLAREPEPQAQFGYAGHIADNGKLSDTLAEIVRSDEFRGRSLAALAPDLVTSVYQALLRREPEAEARISYAANVAERGDLNHVLTEISGSEEFRRRFLTAVAPDLVRELFEGLLEREPEPQARSWYTGQVAETGKLADVVGAIVRSEEFRQRCYANLAPHLVDSMYKGLLEREAEPSALSFYGNQIAERGSVSGTIAEIVGSGEFHDRYWERRLRTQSLHPAITYDTPTLAFLHIQKTAGTSLQNMLVESFGSEHVYREHSDTLHLRSPSDLARYSVFAGHFNHDSLAFIPRCKVNVVALFREPRARLLSLYHFWRAHEPSHRSYGGAIALANQLSMEEFFASSTLEDDPGLSDHMAWVVMGNRQWRAWRAMLRGMQRPYDATSEVISSVIRPAIRTRLREFFLVGLQESFEESTDLLFRLLKRPRPTARVTHSLQQLTQYAGFKSGMERQDVTTETAAALDRLVTIDTIIYAEAKTLLAERLASSVTEPAAAGGARVRSPRRARRAGGRE